MEKLIVIRTLTQLRDLEACIEESNYIAFDTETTGLDKDSKIIGFSICAAPDTGYYVILSEWNIEEKKLVELETSQVAKDLLSKLSVKDLIMHNGIFDCMMVKNNYDIDLMPSLHTDTMLLGHILDENRSNGLKELAVSLYGEDSKQEQIEMKESISKNGGLITKDKYELYKADSELIARYGAKDAILTLKIFYTLVPTLFEQGLDDFFYVDECMPLLRGPTYDLNSVGLRVDPDKLQTLKSKLESECLEQKSFIYKEIYAHVKDKYPGTGKTNTFNIGSSKQLSWLLFFKLGNVFHTLTKEGRNLCKSLDIKLPYSHVQKRDFIRTCMESKDSIYQQEKINPKSKKMMRPKKIGDPWNYIACGKDTLKRLEDKYRWVKVFLEYAKNMKLLTTYVEGIQERAKYNIIRPSFLQHGTTSGRYSSRGPNFQNLPRNDKRLKACIVSRPSKVFVGADYSQLEPRVFASLSKDERLLSCFKNGEDFYSVIGMEVFEKYGCSLKKDDKDSFASLYPKLRDISKVVALSSTYGTTAPKMSPTIGKSIDEAQEIIDNYFDKFPKVYSLMIESHALAKKHGVVTNLFGRPRRMPAALNITNIYGNTRHSDLPYEIRNMLNLAMNHRIQSTAASIMNRAAIAVHMKIKELEKTKMNWAEVKIVLQVHDELILEGPECLKDEMAYVLKDCMENTVKLPGVDLIADPKIANNLADLK